MRESIDPQKVQSKYKTPAAYSWYESDLTCCKALMKANLLLCLGKLMIITSKMPFWLPFVAQLDETFDVGEALLFDCM